MGINGLGKVAAGATVAAVGYHLYNRSKDGYMQQREMLRSRDRADTYMGNVIQERTHYTGVPWLDGIAHMLHNDFPTWTDVTFGRPIRQVKLFWDEMVVQNWMPIAIGALAAGIGFHKQIGQVWNGFWGTVNKMIPWNKLNSRNVMWGLGKLGQGLAYVAAAPFKLVGKIGILPSIPLFGLAAWGAWQVTKATNHASQFEYFDREFNRYESNGGGE